MRKPYVPKAALNYVLVMSGLIISGLAFQNCSGGFSASGGSAVNAQGLSTNGVAQVQMSLKVLDSSGNVVYDDSVANSSLTLKEGQSYNFVVSSAAPPPAGAALSLSYTDLSVINGQPTTVPLKFGSNVLQSGAIAQGTYKMQFQATAPNMVTSSKSYNAAFTCANPTFTASSLGNYISVTGSSNMYNFSVANVIANANGVGPYECALDPTGSSILDTGFQSCSTLFSNTWSNYVSNRIVHVAVKDSCNIVQQVAATVNLPYTEPSVGTEVPFIYGVTSNAMGTAASDSRTSNLTYLATNQSPNIDVQSTTNGSSFTIQASHNYKQASSVNFGVKIALTGLVNTVNTAAGTGSVSAANARISELDYSTDESGDTQVALSFSSQSCVLSNQNAKVIFVAGPPCSTSGGGDQNSSTIEVWGHYKCTGVSSSAGSFTFEGDFDGLDKDVDSCVGGGGGGGGGIVPINF